MKTRINKFLNRGSLLVLTVFFLTIYTKINAQCSEAENATMRKYAELTRNSANTQGCAACASLANLFCIAENGLYKNDKAKVQQAISATKETIKLMGDPICCPELLTKSPNWGQPKTEGTQTNAPQQSKAAQDIQAITNEVNNAINTANNLKAIDKAEGQLQEDLKNIEKLMTENSTLPEREYESEDEINSEYSARLTNLNKLAATHLDIKTKIQNLGYSATGELLSNSSTTGLGVFAGIGALASTDKKESKAFSENAIKKLQSSKSNQLFKHRYKGSDFQLDVIDVKMQEYSSKTYPTDYTSLLDYTLVPGYKEGMNFEAFKKLFPKGKVKNTGIIDRYQMVKADSNSEYYFTMSRKGLKFRLMQLDEVTRYSDVFSPEKLKEYQQKILDEIQFYDNLFNLKPEYSKSDKQAELSEAKKMLNNMSQDEILQLVKAQNPKANDQDILNALKKMESMTTSNSDPINIINVISWSDKTNKSFSLNAKLVVKNDKITLLIMKSDKNLQPANFD